MWWRIDTGHPQDWSWEPFATPRHRFDPPSGQFRVRYAANNVLAAARERFPSRRLTESHGQLMLVMLEGSPPALHLTHQRTLDALDLDDRINTGRIDLAEGSDPLLTTSQDLADCLWNWWMGSPPAVVYRTRTMPSSRSIAFSENTIWEATTARPLSEAQTLLVELVVAHGFDVPASWLR